jgi:hypothetical protein
MDDSIEFRPHDGSEKRRLSPAVMLWSRVLPNPRRAVNSACLHEMICRFDNALYPWLCYTVTKNLEGEIDGEWEEWSRVEVGEIAGVVGFSIPAKVLDFADLAVLDPMGVVDGGTELQLRSWGDGSGVPTSGQHLVIAGIDNNGLLHIRTFDASCVRTDICEARASNGTLNLKSIDRFGAVLSDEPESSLSAARFSAIANLKQQLQASVRPYDLYFDEREQVFNYLTSIIGHTLVGDSPNVLVRSRNEARDAWMYGRWMKGKQAKEIKTELARDHPEWKQIGDSGVHIAIQRFAKRTRKPLPPRRQKRPK